MTFRLLNLIVIGALVFAAAYVYRIKYDSTVQAERLAKIRGEVRRMRDTIAALRAEWSELDNPARIETLAKRHLPLKPISPMQFDSLGQLPERPLQFIKPNETDPIGAIIEHIEESTATTGGIPQAAAPQEADTGATVAPAATPED